MLYGVITSLVLNPITISGINFGIFSNSNSCKINRKVFKIVEVYIEITCK